MQGTTPHSDNHGEEEKQSHQHCLVARKMNFALTAVEYYNTEMS